MYSNLSTAEAVSLLMGDDNDGWSRDGAEALIEYLEELESSGGKSIEFDRIAIRCEYSEYSTALEAAQDYDFTPPETEDDEDEDVIEAAAIAYLEYRTTIIKFNGGVIIQQF